MAKGDTITKVIAVGETVYVRGVAFKAEARLKNISCLDQCDAKFINNAYCSGLCTRYINGDDVVFKNKMEDRQ